MRGLMGDPLFSQKTKEVVDMVKSWVWDMDFRTKTKLKSELFIIPFIWLSHFLMTK